MGQTALLPFRRKAGWGFFSPWKIRWLRPGLNPRTWVPKASTLPLDHWSRLQLSIHLHVLNSITFKFSFFIGSQFKTNAQNVHLNQCTCGHIWSRTVTNFKKSQSGCKRFDRHQKCIEVCLHFQLVLNIVRVSGGTTDKNLKDKG